MTEIRPARPKSDWWKRLPVKGDFSPTALAKHLGTNTAAIRAHCKALDIPLATGRKYREGTVHVKRVYKRHLRMLTLSEAKRIILRHRQLQGQRVLKAAEKASSGS